MAFVRDPDNLIPIMTSDSAPSGYVASASNEDRVETFAYMAFNGEDSAYSNHWSSAGANSNVWLKISLPSTTLVNKYKITPHHLELDKSPKTWYFQGYTGTDWITLDTQLNITTWTASTTKTFIFANNNSYSEYRIYVVENNGGAVVVIGELELCYTVIIRNPSPICIF